MPRPRRPRITRGEMTSDSPKRIRISNLLTETLRSAGYRGNPNERGEIMTRRGGPGSNSVRRTVRRENASSNSFKPKKRTTRRKKY